MSKQQEFLAEMIIICSGALKIANLCKQGSCPSLSMLQIHCSQQPSSQAKTTRVIWNVPQKTASLWSELVSIFASVVELDFP